MRGVPAEIFLATNLCYTLFAGTAQGLGVPPCTRATVSLVIFSPLME